MGFYALNYNSLKRLGDEYLELRNRDYKSSERLMGNLFFEMLSSTGSSAAALLIRDYVMEGKFDNYRDPARYLTAVPFHIRRPNQKLVEEFEKLLNYNGDRYVKMAIPLTFGHLVRMTCERAGFPYSKEHRECLQWSEKYSQMFFDKFRCKND